MTGSVMQVDFGATTAGCDRLGVSVSTLGGDVEGFCSTAGDMVDRAGGTAAEASRRFNDLSGRTVATGLAALNSVRGFMGKAALEIEGLDTRLGRATFAGTAQGK